MQSRSSSNLKGIDISNHNGYVDMAAIKASGIQIVYMKVTEGRTYRDAYFDSNYLMAKAAGLLVGFYHYFHPNSDIDQQVSNFLSVTAGKTPDCKIAIDVEETDGQSASTITSGVITFAQKIKAQTNLDSVIYTYTSFAIQNLDNRLASYPLWIAQYGVNTPSNNPIWNSWIGFQYTDSGSIPGISGQVDLDEFTTDILLYPQTDPMGQVQGSNAVVIKDQLYARDSNGNRIGGYADINDRIRVIDVSYSKQLALIEYPVPGGTKKAYVTNCDCIKYDKDHALHVPYRDVFDLFNMSNQIGWVNNEDVTILEEMADRYNIVYDTNKGRNTKSGVIYKW